MVGGSAAGIGHTCFRNSLRCQIETWHAPAHHAPYCFGRSRRVVLDTRCLIARRDLLGGLHDGAERHGRCAVTLERCQQLGQRIDRVPHHRLHTLVRLDGVVQHPVEHVFHFPREFAEHAGTDQSAGALERMERTADADH